MNRTIVIGDIHGALKALIQVLNQVQLSSSDKLILLGDYIDGWSDSMALINYLIKLNAERDCVFIRGNHDAWLMDWLASGNVCTPWIDNGGTSTLNAYKNCDVATKQKHLHFLENTKYYYIHDNRLYIHAGYTSMHGVEKEIYPSNYYWDRTLWEMAICTNKHLLKTDISFPKRLKHYSEIYIGHTPTLQYKQTVPMNRMNVWNIDTGAGYNGKLSALCVASKQYWQSDNINVLYPNETGRQ